MKLPAAPEATLPVEAPAPKAEVASAPRVENPVQSGVAPDLEQRLVQLERWASGMTELVVKLCLSEPIARLEPEIHEAMLKALTRSPEG